MIKEYKIPFVGDASVGKTSIITRFSHNRFNDSTLPTVGGSNFHVTVDSGGSSVVLNIWDTAGQEKFRSLVPLYTRGADLVVIVFDIAEPESFKGVEEWFNKIRGEYMLKCPVFVVANKIDLEAMLSINEIKKWCSDHDTTVFFTSAATGRDIDTLFDGIAQEVGNRQKFSEEVIGVKGDNTKSENCC